MERYDRTEVGKFWITIANIQRKHSILYLFLVKLSVIWFPLVLTYFGVPLRLIYESEKGRTLSTSGIIITAVLFIAIILNEIAIKKEGSNQELEFFKSGYNALGRLLRGINTVCKQKERTLVSEINKIQSNPLADRPRIISMPSSQLNCLSKELFDCILDFLSAASNKKWRQSDLCVSVLYRYPYENSSWFWATEERGLKLSELTEYKSSNKRNSTMAVLLRGEKNHIFYNSKDKAFKDGKYINDEFDELNEAKNTIVNDGSIACYKRTIRSNSKEYIQFVVSFASYGKHFVDSNDQTEIDLTSHNMQELILNDFMERISIEMCLLYLEELSRRSIPPIPQLLAVDD